MRNYRNLFYPLLFLHPEIRPMSVTFIKKLGRTACAVALLALAARASSAAVFVQPTATGTTPSGLQWSTVSTGSSLPVRSTTLASNGLPGAVVYWNTVTGAVQLDPKGWNLNVAVISYASSTSSILSSTPGPFTYSSGTGYASLSGTTGRRPRFQRGLVSLLRPQRVWG